MLQTTRLVIEGRSRIAELIIINPSTSQKTYSVSFVNFRMSETGELVRADSARPDDCFADQFLRVTPKRIALGAKMQQIVRLQFLRPADLLDGEYRSNLVVSVIPDTASDAASSKDEEGLRIKLTPIYGIAVPVIIRSGATAVTASIVGITLAPGLNPENRTLSFVIERAGNQSLYGDLVVEYIQPGQVPIILEKKKGLTVYATNKRRIVNFPISLPPELVDTFHGGTLRLRYLDTYNAKGKVIPVLASAEIPIP